MITEQMIETCASYMAPLADAIRRSVENRDIDHMIGVNRVINRYLQRNEERARGTPNHSTFMEAMNEYENDAQNRFMVLAQNLHSSAIRRMASENGNTAIGDSNVNDNPPGNPVGQDNAGVTVDHQNAEDEGSDDSDEAVH